MNCPNCGKELKENQKFCNSCGYKLNGVKKKHFPLLALIASGIMLLAALFCCLGINCYNNYALQKSLNNPDFKGQKILMQISRKHIKKNEREIILQGINEKISNIYQNSVYIKTVQYNKIVIYAPLNIKASDIEKNIISSIEFKKPLSKKGNSITWQNSGITNKDIKEISLGSSQSGEWVIEIEFNNEGAKKFADLTRSLVGQQLAIFYNGKLLSAPRVNEQILGGKAQITGGEGGFEYEEAKQIVDTLNALLNAKILDIK